MPTPCKKNWNDYGYKGMIVYPPSRNYKILTAYFHYHSLSVTRGLNKILDKFISEKFTEHQKMEMEQYYDEKINVK